MLGWMGADERAAQRIDAQLLRAQVSDEVAAGSSR
jgi:hypothetical protein